MPSCLNEERSHTAATIKPRFSRGQVMLTLLVSDLPDQPPELPVCRSLSTIARARDFHYGVSLTADHITTHNLVEICRHGGFDRVFNQYDGELLWSWEIPRLQ